MPTANPLNVFITGATTALGREVTRLLAGRGHHVTGLTDGSDNAGKVRQDGAVPAFVTDPFRAGEFRSLLRAAQADVVLHLSPQLANSFPHRSLRWDAISRAITDGTPALLQAAQAVGVQFFVYPSFAFVYGSRHGEWVDEQAPRQPAPLFRAVAAVEDGVLNGAVPAAVVRAGRLYGAYEDGTTGLIETLRRSRAVYSGDPHAVSSWVNVADLAAALVQITEQKPAGEVFNVADDSPGSPADFVNALAQNLGLPPPGNPPAFLRRTMTSEVIDALLGASVCLRTDKARQTLGWSPRYPDFRAGIDHALLVRRAAESAPVKP